MGEWKKHKLNELVDRFAMGPFGSNIKTDNFVEKGVPIIRGTNLNFDKYVGGNFVFLTEEKADQLKSSNCFPGDLVFTHRGTIGQVGLIPKNKFPRYVISQSGMKLSVKREVLDEGFLFYFFKSSTGQYELLKNASQVGVPAISSPLTSLKDVNIMLPPIKEQQSIASILKSLDDKIEHNHQMNETLEAIAKSIFKSWFVDFDPVKAKARLAGSYDGDDMSLEEARAYLKNLDPEIARLFPDAFEESELGRVPRGCHIRPILEFIEILGGGTPKTTIPEYWDGEIPWFSVTDVPRGSNVFVTKTEKTITKKGLAQSSTRLLEPGTTIITARGTVGKLALVGKPMTMNQSCYGLKSKDGANYFVYFQLRETLPDLKKRTHGSVFDTITRGTFESLNALTTSGRLRKTFDLQVASFMNRILKNLNEIETLMELRDTLLPKLISGEIRFTPN